MGLRRVAPVPFGSCFFVFFLFIIVIYVIYLFGVPNKVVQKKKSKVKTTEDVLRFINVQLVVNMVLAQSTSNIIINMWVERFPLE